MSVPRMKSSRKRTVIDSGETLRLWNGEEFSEFAPPLLAIPFPENARTNRKVAIEYAREVCRTIAKQRRDRTCCADDLGLALACMGRDINLGKAAGGIFRNGEWEKTKVMYCSQRVTNNGRQIYVWRLLERIWAQGSLFQPSHFYLT